MDFGSKMFIKGILLLGLVEQTLQQSPTLTKYKRILVTSDSFNEMKMNNYIDDGSDMMREADSVKRIAFTKLEFPFRLSNIMCSSICSTDDVCTAYKYLPRNCSLLNATGLIGTEASSLSAETVMINAELEAGKAY